MGSAVPEASRRETWIHSFQGALSPDNLGWFISASAMLAPCTTTNGLRGAVPVSDRPPKSPQGPHWVPIARPESGPPCCLFLLSLQLDDSFPRLLEQNNVSLPSGHPLPYRRMWGGCASPCLSSQGVTGSGSGHFSPNPSLRVLVSCTTRQCSRRADMDPCFGVAQCSRRGAVADPSLLSDLAGQQKEAPSLVKTLPPAPSPCFPHHNN